MNRQEYIELVNAWKSFIKDSNLNNNKNIISENFRNTSVDDSIENIQDLIEWGDRVESIINEHIDIRILESYHLNEGIFSAFRKAKDDVKQNNTKENAAEYTLAARAVGSLMTGVKVLSIIAALAPKLGVDNYVTPEVQKYVFELVEEETSPEDIKIAKKVTDNPEIVRKAPQLKPKQTKIIIKKAIDRAIETNPNSDLDKYGEELQKEVQEKLKEVGLIDNPNDPHDANLTVSTEDMLDAKKIPELFIKTFEKHKAQMKKIKGLDKSTTITDPDDGHDGALDEFTPAEIKMIVEMARNHAYAMFLKERGKLTPTEIAELSTVGYDGEADKGEIFEQHPIGDIQSFVYYNLMSDNLLSEFENIETLDDIKNRFFVKPSAYQTLDGIHDELGGKMKAEEVKKILEGVNKIMAAFILNNAGYVDDDWESSPFRDYFNVGEVEAQGLGSKTLGSGEVGIDVKDYSSMLEKD